MGEKTWKKGEELIKKMPELKTNCEVIWKEIGAGDNLILLCKLLKGNGIPTKLLDLDSDKKEEMGRRCKEIDDEKDIK